MALAEFIVKRELANTVGEDALEHVHFEYVPGVEGSRTAPRRRTSAT